ncbi:DNA binding domain-containing protein, excisionase family [Neorhodopirellula lusitana]|uniref:DNA binding domain-containing protein, excisionase family n=1 Tax=Neorhodopirellula lusitana TaxID=445327 RepID=A0ABY1PQ06_9BACT|nr:helix-turn-helix domain-containing protein [Neorhodopirellula lusitana]SMP41618.1 DNA binding domain-containing protein, excisionase family [Neorhodopirellula lusitana]
MNRSLIFEGIEPDQLSECIARAVVDALKPILAESSRPLLVDSDEMARLAGISRPHLDRMRADGRIPSVLIGRRRLYRPDAVIAALEAGQATVVGNCSEQLQPTTVEGPTNE